jgi:hypothetical protein
MRYGYEILGGILIFLSSLVTEQIADKWKRRSWIAFGILAAVYIGVGIEIDIQAAVSEKGDRQTISALSGAVETVRSELDTVRSQNSAMLKFAGDNLTREQARELFQAMLQNQSATARKAELIAMYPTIDRQMSQLFFSYSSVAERMRSQAVKPDADPQKIRQQVQELEGGYTARVRVLMGTVNELRSQLLRLLPPADAKDPEKCQRAFFEDAEAGKAVSISGLDEARQCLDKIVTKVQASK